MNKTSECFGYVRVSTVKQGEGVSLGAQKDAIQAFADKNSLSITQWFEEKQTAAKSGRPVFLAMIKLLNQGKASGLIVHKIDRSARNFADWAKIGDLPDAGIDVHFAAESIDFGSRGGRLTADIQAVIAADFIRNQREEVKKGMEGRLKQGLFPWGAPIGYVNNGGGKPKTICSKKGLLVRKLFELYGSGEYSLWMLVDAAHKIGLRNAKGNPVGKCCIENMLSNPFYIGLIHVKRGNRTFQGVHKPLISNTLFQQVAAVRAGKYEKKATKHEFTYRRVFTCKACDKAIIGERQKGIVYYRCHTKGCWSGAMREDEIDRQVTSQLEKVSLPDSAIELLQLWLNETFSSKPSAKIVNTTPMLLASIDDRKCLLVDALLDGKIDQETYENRNRQLLFQATELRDKFKESEKSAPKSTDIANLLELLKSLYFTYSMAIPAEKRQIVKTLYSNRQIEAKKLYIQPRNWLVGVSETLGYLLGAPHRSTSRSSQEVEVQAIENLNEVLQDPNYQMLVRLHREISEGQSG